MNIYPGPRTATEQKATMSTDPNPGPTEPRPDLSQFRLGRILAYQGKKDCTSVTCTRFYGPDGRSKDCHGWHCPTCHEPVSSMGHDCTEAEDQLDRLEP